MDRRPFCPLDPSRIEIQAMKYLGITRPHKAEDEFLSYYVRDHYMLFFNLMHYLEKPYQLQMCGVDAHSDASLLQELVIKYYKLDTAFARELFGKRLHDKIHNFRELTVKTGILWRSYQRQYQNVLRIYKRIVKWLMTSDDQLSDPLVDISSSYRGRYSEEWSRRYEGIKISMEEEEESGEKSYSSASGSTPKASPTGVQPSRSQSRGLNGLVRLTPRKTLTRLCEELQSKFQLPILLGEQYFRFTYASYNTFEFKKYFSHLEYQDLDALVMFIIEHWGLFDLDSATCTLCTQTVNADDSISSHSNETSHLFPSSSIQNGISTEKNTFSAKPNEDTMLHPKCLYTNILVINPIFSSGLRDLKTLIFNNKGVLAAWSERVKSKTCLPKRTLLVAWESKVSTILKAIFSISQSTQQPKDYRKLFFEIIKKIVNPSKKARLTMEQLSMLLKNAEAEGQVLIQNANLPDKETRLSSVWSAYFAGLCKCVLYLNKKNTMD
ncbi:uncharacterized protein LOC126325917 [Schistocerca gregaria]|uniref:uncharacterized protein LOC126325917 n=1 Tax=Schistocerca gregaria TaxID=7010 RepID=UPI00211E564F|nr:uncharacterized protein LOC126325917 [Schistocerca gregaria]